MKCKIDMSLIETEKRYTKCDRGDHCLQQNNKETKSRKFYYLTKLQEMHSGKRKIRANVLKLIAANGKQKLKTLIIWSYTFYKTRLI